MTKLSFAAVAGVTLASHAVACRSSPSASTARPNDSASAAGAQAISSADTNRYDEVSAGASFPSSSPSFAAPTLLYMGARRSGDAIRSVLRTRADFERAWRDAWSNWKGVLPPLPALDFTREMVIVAAMGSGDGAADRIGVTRVTDANNVLAITVEIHAADPKCGSFARVRYPIVMVTVPATSSTPVFEDRVVQRPC